MINNEEEEDEYKINQSIQMSSDQLKMAVQGKLEVFDAGLVNLSITSWGEYVRISIQTPPGKDPVQNDIVVVLDISGSMDTIAEVKNQQGVKENNGLTILDLLKHSTKTIIQNLNENDRFCLVTYSDQGRIEYSLSYMTEENKILATMATENLETEGNTNLWGGLYCGMEVLRNHRNSKHHQTIMLLTDGEPNIHPPSGEINQLIKYRNQYKDFQPTIHTYAQGKKINSELLNQYAFIGNGQYNFIPCPGFIGTIFVNSIAFILSTFASECELIVEPLNGAKIESIPGGLPYKQNKIQIGNLQYEQSRDIIVKITHKQSENIQKDQAFLNAYISFFDHIKNQKILGKVINQIKFEQDDPLAGMHLCRITYVDSVKQAVLAMKQKDYEKAKNIIKDLSQFITKMIGDIEILAQNQQNNENTEFFKVRAEIAIKYLVKLLKDVDGEATLAVAQTWSFDQWGQHYLPSISHAHLKQQKNNYMDPGIQSYGGKFIRDVTDKVEQTFLNLPAPKPSRKEQVQGQKHPIKQIKNKNKQNQPQIHPKIEPQPQQQKIKSREPSPEPPIDMNLYYQGGGCFEGKCLVTLANNDKKQIQNIRKGDMVKSIDGTINQVVAIVKIICENSKTQLVSLSGGLLITPNHPIFWKGKWFKPSEIKQPIEMNCDAVYNLILDGGHTIKINQYHCVTLGHGFKEDKLAHPYFGTELVLNDLKLSTFYPQGFIQFRMEQFIRNQSNQQVCGIKIFYGKKKYI